ncbi:MAG: DUF6714 family protein [Janthinobacterium lividum]
MSADDLLAELTACFEHEPYPGDDNLVTNNEPGYDLESLQIRDTFKVYTWQTLPDALMLYEQGGYHFLSKRGLKYYLPAYLGFAVRAYAEADSIPDGLIFSLTLPTAQDDLALERTLAQLAEQLPASDWPAYQLTHRSELTERVAYFFNRYEQFSGAQGRAIYHFLVFMHENYGRDYFNDEPNVAIQRCWFQFA